MNDNDPVKTPDDINDVLDRLGVGELWHSETHEVVVEGGFTRPETNNKTFCVCRPTEILRALRMVRDDALNEHAELRTTLQRYREALEHYADGENWEPSQTVTDDMDDADYDRLAKDWYACDDNGYDVARAALKENDDDQ
jgi:hypothetical protein